MELTPLTPTIPSNHTAIQSQTQKYNLDICTISLSLTKQKYVDGV